MEKLIQSISVFFPAYNEEKNIGRIAKDAKSLLDKIAEDWEIIIINDGSKDKTKEISERLAQEDKRIRVINHLTNRGYGASLKSGFYNSKNPWIAFTDSDGQFDFSEITKFIKKQKATRADLVIGYYIKRKVPFYRKLNTFLWQKVVFLLFGLNVRDIDCGFKLISKKVIDRIPPLESERGAFISSELLIKAIKAGFRIVEIPVHHYPRRVGRGTGASLNVIIRSFIDLFKLWRKIR